MALLYVFGVLGVRYVERMPSATVGYLLLAALGLLLSSARAKLYRRALTQPRPAQDADGQALTSMLLHNLNYLLMAFALYLVVAWLFRISFQLPLLVPLWIGAMLPDLDSRDSLPGRLVPYVARRLGSRCEHLEAWHTPAAAIAAGLAATPLGLLFGAQVVWVISFGFLAHLIIDLLAPQGIMLLWPWRRTRYSVLGGLIQAPGSSTERALAVGLGLVVTILLLFADLEGPKPVQTAAPSYQQTLARYYGMRGRTQVFAYIEGSWQVSGRPINGWFEILNASGDSYVLRDRYDSMIFSAGQTRDENVYLNRVVLQAGSAITVKPVEIHLDHQKVSDALGIVYAMQTEPGLLHIYVSGELILPESEQENSLSLNSDLSQTNLRQIRRTDEGHYSLHYLTAADLIALSSVQVDTANLVVTATYSRAVPGPTVTPLPSPPASKEHDP